MVEIYHYRLDFAPLNRDKDADTKTDSKGTEGKADAEDKDKEGPTSSVAVVGRTLDEYVEAFALDWKHILETKPRILDIPSGLNSLPISLHFTLFSSFSFVHCLLLGFASFVAEGTKLGLKITGVEPMYSNESLVQRVKQEVTQSISMSKTQTTTSTAAEGDAKSKPSKPQSHWDAVELPLRRKAAALWSADFEQGVKEGRYLTGLLPKLPLPNEAFDLVLSGFFLFCYADKQHGGLMTESTFDLQFHIDAITELLRVCAPGGCVCVYPIYSWPPFRPLMHPYVDPVIKHFQGKGIRVEQAKSSYWSCYDDIKYKTKPDYPNTVLRLHKPRA